VVAHLYHLVQQKLRYEIVKNRSRNTQIRLYFDLKIANFLKRLGAPPDLIAYGSWGLRPQTLVASGGRGLRLRIPFWVIQNLPS